MTDKTKKVVHLVAAARPNFMKIAPLYHALSATHWCDPKIVHTGQHYDFNMSDAFFRDLGLPDTHYHLGVGSGTHAEQTGNVMIAYEKVAMDASPDAIVVVGDVNSTAACAMVGTKLWIPVVHLEAGLRSGDRSMPEEINRLVTDAIADVLWTPSADADENLMREGVDAGKIDLIGNMMIDSFELLRSKIEASNARQDLELTAGGYGVLTMHRPSNVDDKSQLAEIVDSLCDISSRMQLVFVSHPRTMKNLQQFDLLDKLNAATGIKVLDPVPYIDFMNIVTGAALAITDSGGLQEETSYLGIPCLTMRENTERPITITSGTNRLVNHTELRAAVKEVMAGNWPGGAPIPYWDGATAERAAQKLKVRLFA